jgi:hypothetical protein
MIIQLQPRLDGPRRRPRRMETPAARYARRLGHLARMRDWYARRAAEGAAGGTCKD